MKKLIELDAALKTIGRVPDYGDGMVFEALSHAQRDVELLPTVDAVQVVHGRWIDIDSEMYTWKIRCSKCGHERSMMSTGHIYPMYCEDCGAKMDGKNGDNG